MPLRNSTLPADTVKWGHKVTALQPLGDGRHEVTFANGATVMTGLLVGADGVWSRVTSFIETYLFDADERHPASAKAVGGGAMYALIRRALAAHPNDVEAALTEYEQALFPRSTAEAAEAHRDFELIFGTDTPRSLLGLFTLGTQTG